jgi:DNA-binding LacI/PurR family transcriptional regulator
VAVDSSDDPWFAQFLTGVEEELATRTTSLLLVSLGGRGQHNPSLVLHWIRDRRIDGLILVKAGPADLGLLHAAQTVELPTVAVAPECLTPGTQIVRCDNHAAGTAVANHLAALGHRCIAFVGGPANAIDSEDRLRGLRDGLAYRGLTLQPTDVFSSGSWEATAGSVFAEAFFARDLRVTAVVLANDALAFGFLRVAHKRGIRVPVDLSIVGFDGLPDGTLLSPPLTTVGQPMREMGRIASRRLFAAIERQESKVAPDLPMRLTVRESTGRARGRQEVEMRADGLGGSMLNATSPGCSGSSRMQLT